MQIIQKGSRTLRISEKTEVRVKSSLGFQSQTPQISHRTRTAMAERAANFGFLMRNCRKLSTSESERKDGAFCTIQNTSLATKSSLNTGLDQSILGARSFQVKINGVTTEPSFESKRANPEQNKIKKHNYSRQYGSFSKIKSKIRSQSTDSICRQILSGICNQKITKREGNLFKNCQENLRLSTLENKKRSSYLDNDIFTPNSSILRTRKVSNLQMSFKSIQNNKITVQGSKGKPRINRARKVQAEKHSIKKVKFNEPAPWTPVLQEEVKYSFY